MLTDAELDSMRAVAAGAMPDRAAITRRGATRNAMGGRDTASAAVSGLEAVPCHVHPDNSRGAGEGPAQSRTVADARWRITFPYGTDVRESDTATIGTRRYELVQVDADRSWALEVEAFGVRRS